MSLQFWPGAIAMMLIATMAATLMANGGRSAWFVGVLILMVYAIFAMTLFCFRPQHDSVEPAGRVPIRFSVILAAGPVQALDRLVRRARLSALARPAPEPPRRGRRQRRKAVAQSSSDLTAATTVGFFEPMLADPKSGPFIYTVEKEVDSPRPFALVLIAARSCRRCRPLRGPPTVSHLPARFRPVHAIRRSTDRLHRRAGDRC